ncbi:hypothetical protein SBOR_0775 [Sclerotinia borealis F-4128]|uniref:BZIP domain-containing protein n=1 Tax=Sclerotinia borealis (strain F-4128) TaxID=1432307 RepID=W9CQ39_SCLBF|nr:hypothetical protein SBOR_0775 [Sclerotinia borealis F-4128]
MNPTYDGIPLQQDNYALTILTQAAMQTNTINTSSSNNSDSISSATGSGFPSNNRSKIDSALKTRDAGYHSRATPATTSLSSSTISNHPTDISQYHLSPSVSNLTQDYTRPHRAMESLLFNPTEQVSQNVFMNHPFQPIYPGSLGILNAEKYDDGRSSIGSHNPSMMSMRGQMQNPMPFGMLEKNGDSSDTKPPSEEHENGKKRRKRARNESPSLEDDEEARKKARGRPRVDTKDETAADRRRTQIRMAQRAYRHRKETTISSLEKQVQELRGTNEEMNNIFINLYDFAISKGLLQREPEFGQQLQSTTEQFLVLAKQSASDDNSRDGGDSPDKITHEPHLEAKNSLARRSIQRSSPPIALPKEPILTEAVNPWGGYTVSKDTSFEDERQTEDRQQDTKPTKPFEVISRATEDNASFLFDSMDIQNYRAEIPSPTIDHFSQDFYPHVQVPLPATHSYFELSFARRVHRATMEQGYQLLTMKNPPKKRFQEVFGFCLTYETKDEIIARVTRTLNSSAKESLQNWRAPFVHLGGAGTYYPNQGPDTDNEFMPKFRTGFSMGPFSAAFTPIRENINSDMRCSIIPGFEGEFFDSNDVEGYLRGHGFDLPPAADFITGQIDLEVLSEVGSPGTASTDSRFPPTPRSPIGNVINENIQNTYNFDYINGDLSKEVQTDGTSSFMTFPSWSNDSSKGPNVFNLTGPIFDATTGLNSGNTSPIISANNKQYTEKRTVTISVETLIRELATHASCLGRAPGYRRSDVNAAIITAAREAGF